VLLVGVVGRCSVAQCLSAAKDLGAEEMCEMGTSSPPRDLGNAGLAAQNGAKYLE